MRYKDEHGEWHELEFFQGDSAYDIAVRHGFKGTEEEFLESLKGEPYTLTEADKDDIVKAVMEDIDTSVGGDDGNTCVVKYINNESDIPIYFTEMESGIYVLRGLFHNFNVLDIELKDRETEFNFDTDTFVELFVNPNPDWGEIAVVAMIHEQGKIHNHTVIKTTTLTCGYDWENEYIEPLNTDGLLKFGLGTTTNLPPWEQPDNALLLDEDNGLAPFINFGQNYIKLATQKYVDDALTTYDTEAKTYLERALALLGEDGDGE